MVLLLGTVEEVEEPLDLVQDQQQVELEQVGMFWLKSFIDEKSTHFS